MVLRSARRQNHACKQCYRSKKACDGYDLNRQQSTFQVASITKGNHICSDAELGVRPCSYCARTNKKCTLNPSWAVSRHQTRHSLVAVVPKADAIGEKNHDGDPIEASLRNLTSFTPTNPRRSPPSSNRGLHPSNMSLDISAKLSTSQYSLSFLCGDDSKDFLDEKILQTHSPVSISTDVAVAQESPDRSQRNLSIDSACLSPASIDSLLARRTTNCFTTGNLLQIYQEVLENNLMCWVSEKTCPYLMVEGADTSPTGKHRDNPGPQIYQNVMRLDGIFQQAGVIHLAPTESKAASRALDSAIMAFAGQWQRNRQPQFPSENGMSYDFMEDLELDMQQIMWEEAKSALDQVSDLECCRVMYAELIFGLTERPGSRNNDTGFDIKPGNATSVAARVIKILSSEKPPIYLERAARKMHALKYQLDKSKNSISPADRCTVGLLYWLTVMMDTLSSVLYERPLVLADEVCQPRATKEGNGPRRWKLDDFVQSPGASPLSWPCPHDLAATEIMKSVPIVVLLYRQIYYLQSAFRWENFRISEETLQDVISTIQYWNKTFGLLVRGLLRNFQTVPSRLRSWFTGVHISWSQAVLTISDLLDTVQIKGLKHELPNLAQIAAKIRQSSAIELSDLARTINYRAGSVSGGTAEVQLSDSPVLTQPYTLISTWAFARAATFHLCTAKKLLQDDHAILGCPSRDHQESMERYVNCVKSLWWMGGTSTQARRIAGVFLDKQCERF